MILDNIVMCEMLHNIADGDCSKILILLEGRDDSDIDLGENSLYLRVSNVRADQFVMQEAIFSLKKFSTHVDGIDETR